MKKTARTTKAVKPAYREEFRPKDGNSTTNKGKAQDQKKRKK